MLSTVNISAGATSQPVFAPAGSLVTAIPASGASAFVEYTKSGAMAVQNGVAVWSSWNKGTVSASASDILNEDAYIRVTALGGVVTLGIDTTPSNAQTDNFRRDWGGTANSPIILAQSGVASSVTGTTTETTLATITIPGGMMGQNGMLRLTTLWTLTNNANSKTLRGKLGGGTFFAPVNTGNGSYNGIATLRNRSSASQVFLSAGNPTIAGGAGGPAVTLAIDTTVDQPLLITAQLASATDTATLEGYTVEVLPA